MAAEYRQPVRFNPRVKDITRKYTNGEVTIAWRPRLCNHSMICFEGLPEVFDPDRRPWINPWAADTQTIIHKVKECPSGALSYFMNDGSTPDSLPVASDAPGPAAEITFEVLPDGPMLVRGQITILDAGGNRVRKGPVTAFCRCGATNNKPFCDGAHKKIGFKG